MIPIRLTDFIQYAREVNNDLSNGRHPKERRTMKDNLNALDALYQDYIEDLRNKFGGHFKDIDFFERIQLWGQINEEVCCSLFYMSRNLPMCLQLDQAAPDSGSRYVRCRCYYTYLKRSRLGR